MSSIERGVGLRVRQSGPVIACCLLSSLIGRMITINKLQSKILMQITRDMAELLVFFLFFLSTTISDCIRKVLDLPST